MPLPPSEKKRKVKSGCRTCRIRRVKCDEGRPSCQRCVATGRVCDGYGIWGGGGTNQNRPLVHPRQRQPSRRFPGHVASLPVHTVTGDERLGFEWFMTRSRVKFPGVFDSEFWALIVSQASWSEPAVMQAVLALSLAHKRDVLGDVGMDMHQGWPDEQERIVLRHYSRAIRLLRPHFSANNKSSLRVALITCLVFICFQFLRGEYKTGYTLLQNGLGLLRDLQARSTRDTSFILRSQHQSIDDCLTESFVRLDVQAGLLGYGSRQQYVISLELPPRILPPVFQSVQTARQQLEAIIHEILRVSQLCGDLDASEHVYWHSEILNCQQNIQTGLSSWLTAYEATQHSLNPEIKTRDSLAYGLLRTYHIMASIMAVTYTSTARESAFDLHEDSFASLISHCTELLSMASSTTVFDASLGGCIQTQRQYFIADMGIIAPLYFAALKCRQPRLRLQAIRLLVSTTYNEGIWNGKVAGSIAWEVMKMEEWDGTLERLGDSDIPSLCGVPGNCDGTSRPWSRVSRVHDVHLKLTDNPSEKATFSCRREKRDGSWEVIERECEVAWRSNISLT